MKASLKPLGGKYYGTIICVNFEDSEDPGKDQIHEFKLWDSGNYYPSIREMEGAGITKKQYDNNEVVNMIEGIEYTAKDELEICDSHFESELTYNRAMKLINLINSGR